MARRLYPLMVLALVLVVLSGCEITVNPIASYQTVFFHSNGQTAGSVPVFSITALVGTQVTIPGNTGNLVKNEHEFTGWNTESDGSGNHFQPGDVFAMPAGNVMLYAAWERLYVIGQTGPAGGIVFYDKGEKSDGWRYLEAAPAATEWTTRIWGEQYAEDIAGTSDAIGAGAANTQLITAAFLNANGADYAAFLCANLEYGGFRDWYLPSKQELYQMYLRLHQYGLGAFKSDYAYWSSTADVTQENVAYTVYFPVGLISQSSTFYEQHVRAIRAF
jgi:hypothetical protein